MRSRYACLGMVLCYMSLCMVWTTNAFAAAKSSNTLNQNTTPVPYVGKRLSLNFQDIPVRSALQLLADFNGMNLVADDNIKGRMTLRLHNIPWDEALDIILNTQQLSKQQMGNVLIIMPSQNQASQHKQMLENQAQISDLVPPQDIMIHLNYAKANDIAKILKDKNNSLLSERGSVSIDDRTNSVLIRDTPASLKDVQHLVSRLDVPVPQVLIQARIVNMDTNAEKDLGVKWGITQPMYLSGSIKGASDMYEQANDNKLRNNADMDNRLNVNLPAPALRDGSSVQPASVGIAMAKLGHGFMLDLELQALEAEGNASLISSPRLMTANQHPATIKSGTEIPYQQSTSSGATSVAFRNAELSLTVTPQVTPNQKIIMDLHVTQNKVGADVSTGEGGRAPTIDTREITTHVWVDNGQTIVLGGIYEDNQFSQLYRVPFFGRIPGIGFFFRSTQVSRQRSELLIFITPTIVTDNSGAAAI